MIAWPMLMVAAAAVQAEPAGSPSAAALALANAMSNRPSSREVVERVASGIAQSLLNTMPAWKGVGCDPEVLACRSTAERLGRDAAGPVLAERRALKDRMLAIVIEETMTPTEIADASAFVHTTAGRSLAAALERLSDPAAMSPALREKLGKAVTVAPPDNSMRALFDRFHDLTAKLPRRTLPLIPPPPQPSSHARKP